MSRRKTLRNVAIAHLTAVCSLTPTQEGDSQKRNVSSETEVVHLVTVCRLLAKYLIQTENKSRRLRRALTRHPQDDAKVSILSLLNFTPSKLCET